MCHACVMDVLCVINRLVHRIIPPWENSLMDYRFITVWAGNL